MMTWRYLTSEKGYQVENQSPLLRDVQMAFSHTDTNIQRSATWGDEQ